MQDKQERFANCMSKIQVRNEAIELRLAQYQHYPFFTPTLPGHRSNKMAELLEHLEKYRANTNELIKKDSENEAFYSTHFEAVVSLLEKIEEMAPKLVLEDFVLVIPQPVPYKKSSWDRLYEIYLFATYTSGIGGVALGVVLGLLGAVVGFLVGVLAGCLLGFLAGAVIAPFIDVTPYLHDNDKPFNYSYLNGDAFNCNLLKDAYENAYKVPRSANDETVEIVETNEQETSIQTII